MIVLSMNFFERDAYDWARKNSFGCIFHILKVLVFALLLTFPISLALSPLLWGLWTIGLDINYCFWIGILVLFIGLGFLFFRIDEIDLRRQRLELYKNGEIDYSELSTKLSIKSASIVFGRPAGISCAGLLACFTSLLCLAQMPVPNGQMNQAAAAILFQLYVVSEGMILLFLAGSWLGLYYETGEKYAIGKHLVYGISYLLIFWGGFPLFLLPWVF